MHDSLVPQHCYPCCVVDLGPRRHIRGYTYITDDTRETIYPVPFCDSIRPYVRNHTRGNHHGTDVQLQYCVHMMHLHHNSTTSRDTPFVLIDMYYGTMHSIDTVIYIPSNYPCVARHGLLSPAWVRRTYCKATHTMTGLYTPTYAHRL